jgi:catechol 2,3-dioxygenase-like lactoylglutathione lyase family enzyme
MLNHAAWVTHDVEATAEFYTRIMGMELATTIFDDHVPSTGDAFPYFHIFFRMQDGSTLAFFEAPGLPPRAAPMHPAYGIFDHVALQVADRTEVLRWHEWLKANGVEVIGPTDHKGTIPASTSTIRMGSGWKSRRPRIRSGIAALPGVMRTSGPGAT